jgi:sodium/potassium-transporting ATPase subunit alpha
VGPTEAGLSFLVFFMILMGGGWIYGERLTATDPLYMQAAGAFLATIIFSQIGNVNACRTNRQSALKPITRFNPWITAGILVEIVFICAIIYVPVFHEFFTTWPLDIGIWPLICIAPFVIFFVEEIRKYLVRRGVSVLSA